MTSILSQIQQPSPPASIPDPQPHLAPGADTAGSGDPAGQLAQLLSSGGDPAPGAGDPAGGPYGPDPGTGPDNAGAAHATSEIDHLKQLLGLAHSYMSIKSVEPAEAHQMSKAVQIITKILADNQQQTDQIAGGNPAMRKAMAQ